MALRYCTDNGEAGTNAGHPVPRSLQAPFSCCCWLFILPGVPQASCNCSSVSAINWGEIARCYDFKCFCSALFLVVQLHVCYTCLLSSRSSWRFSFCFRYSFVIFLSDFSLKTYCRPVFKLTDSFLGCVQSTEQPMEDILLFCSGV